MILTETEVGNNENEIIKWNWMGNEGNIGFDPIDVNKPVYPLVDNSKQYVTEEVIRGSVILFGKNNEVFTTN